MKKTTLIIMIIGLFSPIITCAAANEAAPFQVHIRSLAASCAACHGTQGNAMPAGDRADATVALAGAKKADIIAKLMAFRSGERNATVMHHHAKGLTPDEITALAEYFSAQTPRAPVMLKTQEMREDHAN